MEEAKEEVLSSDASHRDPGVLQEDEEGVIGS